MTQEVVRLTAGGRFDTTFGETGAVTLTNVQGSADRVALQADGRVVVAGGYYDPGSGDYGTRVVRVKSNGGYDATFAAYESGARGDSDSLYGLEVGPGGKVYVALAIQGGISYVEPFRLNPDGTVDRVFDHFRTGFSQSADVGGIGVGSDGRLVMVGKFLFNGLSGTGLPIDDPGYLDLTAAVRWDVDGSFDHSFGGSGLVTVGRADNALLTPDDRLLAFDLAGGKLRAERRAYNSPEPTGVTLGAGGLLGVEGTNGPDTIRVTRTGTSIRVSARGSVRTFAADKVKAVFVDGGDGNDAITVDVPAVPTRVTGGRGNDTLTGGSLVYAGAGDDRVVVRQAGADVYAGRGADVVDCSTAIGHVDGGEDDFLSDGEDHGTVNTLTFAGRTAPLALNVQTSLFGYATLAGTEDRPFAYTFNTFVGGKGNDTIKITAAESDEDLAVRLVGRPGNDLLVGNVHDDILEGGPGKDRLYGMAGNDLLSDKDGVADYLDGGPGKDRAIKDPIDAIFSVETIG